MLNWKNNQIFTDGYIIMHPISFSHDPKPNVKVEIEIDRTSFIDVQLITGVNLGTPSKQHRERSWSKFQLH